jgi:hypothetical protein
VPQRAFEDLALPGGPYEAADPPLMPLAKGALYTLISGGTPDALGKGGGVEALRLGAV